jgi:hypothetical protein
MADYIKIAKKWSKAGYSVIPVNSEKNPAISVWIQFQRRPMTPEECELHFKDVWGIALLMGTDKKLTALDLDLKYSLDKFFLGNYKKKLGKKLLSQFYVQSTKNKGMHFVFSSDKIENNMKLASRETSPEEKNEVYVDNYENLRTRGKALKIAMHYKSLAFLETRGEGGYIVMAPSPGYESIYGKIGHLSSEDYDEIMTISRSFNEFSELNKDYKIEKYRNSDVNPFEEFIQRGDILSILYDNGWEEIRETGNYIRLKRAGNPSSKSSALYDKVTKVFTVFSTSTNFEPNRGYSAASVFVELEAEGDTELAYKLLVNKGFGEKIS